MTIKKLFSKILGNKDSKSGAALNEDAPLPFHSTSTTTPSEIAAKPELINMSTAPSTYASQAKFNPSELNQFPKYKEFQQKIAALRDMITPSTDLDLVALQAERRQAFNNIIDRWIDLGFPPADEGSIVYKQLMPPIKPGKDADKVRYGEYVHLYHDIGSSTRESDQIKNLVNWILILKNYANINPAAYMTMIEELYGSNDPEAKALATVMAIIVESPLVNEAMDYPGRVREQPFRDALENAFRQLYQLTAKMTS